MSDCVSLLVDHIKQHCSDVDVIVGLDARGFIFGSLVAQQLCLPFVPVRKEGKLPGETIKVAYTLEYAKVINKTYIKYPHSSIWTGIIMFVPRFNLISC